ncbi:chloride channel protein [Lutimonas zeaxanthinifaciens]|uniref:chloride channel protein n=1 Tax=Lutimonas zeaxanthinifaciens TaxID=3060215 RepID=UPI00265D0F5D|nr:chloride channel protein [Lutimonas sp. YSD2104]WKK66171.1 chloride channel protein [Lutimonas sp. YSD2104]
MPTLKKLRKRFFKWRYKHITNQQFIYALSILVGFLAGLGTVIIKNLTHFIQSLLQGKIIVDYHHSLYFIFPLIGLILVYLIQKYVIRRKIGHAIPSTLFSLSKRKGLIERYKMYASLITAPLTVGFGGSVGLQGPAINTGAAVASNIAQYFHVSARNRSLLIGCASAGAVASMFKAPIAAVIFAVEIFSLDLAFASMIPLLLASVSAVITSYLFLGSEILFSFEIQDKFSIDDILFYVVLGIGSAIASVYFSKMYFWITGLFDRIHGEVKKLFIGGIIIGILLFFIPPLYGEGFDLINNLLRGNHMKAIGSIPFAQVVEENIWMIILLLIGITVFKAVAMTVTFSAGGVGGIFIPTLVMGSALGNVYAKVVNNLGWDFSISESNFTLIGMTGLMAGVLHAPLTAIFLIADITGGYELFVPLMIVSAISFSLTRYYVSNSIYTMELAKKGELLTHNKDKNVLMMMEKSKLIERDFVKIKPEYNLGEMLNKAVTKSKRNIFPVVNEKNEFLGILLLDDIRNIMFDQNMYDKVQVEELMHRAPDIIFHEKDNMETIMEKFKQTGAWNLPVVKKGEYHGFISKSKLLTAYRRQLIEVTT